MKKLIFTVTNDLSYDQRMQRICGTLAESGYDVLLVGRKLKTSLPLSETKYSQRRIKCWFNKGKLFYSEFNIRLFFFLLFKKMDCICAIDLDTILPCYYISKLKGVKCVYDAHEYFSQLDEVVSRPKIYNFWHGIEKKMIPKFKNGYTVCDSLAEEFKKKYNANYKVVRNVPLLIGSNEQTRSGEVILYQGAVNKGRGLDKLALAMKNVNATLWVCGNGNFMDEMRSVVQANELSEKVIFFGMLPPEELRKRTAKAYIAVNPFERTGLNQYLSLSNKFFDYIHADIPQVTMNYPEYKKINDQFKIAELIDDLVPETIANSIKKILNNKELYLQLRQNCLAAKQQLNWQKEKEKLLAFYKELLNE
ncbi:MAG TPA: glycosyltransferase [Chitinophagaceae bacterium]|nr:glycosyltransferase [Chitinophagaceae bacterium]